MNNYGLTARELEVLYFLTLCYTNKEIAKTLHVTHHTIKAHISAILIKLGCKNRTNAALFAKEHIDFNLPPNSEQP